MASNPSHQFGNFLLRDLPEPELDVIVSRFETVALEPTLSPQRAGEEISSILFIESGLVSVVGAAGRERGIDVCLIGREGAVGAEALLGAGRGSQEHVVQLEGRGVRVPLDLVCGEQLPTLRRRLLRYVQTLLVQSVDAAASSGMSTIEVRLARWLLMCHDRIDGDEIQITHMVLSRALGVRRAGITVALHMLEGEKLIRSLRERIIIRDRLGLETAAHGTYGHSESEYGRLLGPLTTNRPTTPAEGERQLHFRQGSGFSAY